MDDDFVTNMSRQIFGGVQRIHPSVRVFQQELAALGADAALYFVPMAFMFLFCLFLGFGFLSGGRGLSHAAGILLPGGRPRRSRSTRRALSTRGAGTAPRHGR